MPKESIPTVTLPKKPVRDVCALQQSVRLKLTADSRASVFSWRLEYKVSLN